MGKQLKLMTFNLRCVWSGVDGINNFIHRAGAIFDKIDREQPDVICFQEVWEYTATFLRRHLTEYEVYYRGRDAQFQGEGPVIALRRNQMELMLLDFFWLSPTPYVPGSRFEEQSTCPRVCQVAMVRHAASGERFWVYNNHLDHISDSARILGIRQVMARVTEDQQKFRFPVFIVGDFNARPDSETIRFCNEYESFPIVELTADCGGTFHGFGTRDPHVHIDYIYADSATARRPHTIERWTDEEDGIYLSDHFPICLHIDLEKTEE